SKAATSCGRPRCGREPAVPSGTSLISTALLSVVAELRSSTTRRSHRFHAIDDAGFRPHRFANGHSSELDPDVTQRADLIYAHFPDRKLKVTPVIQRARRRDFDLPVTLPLWAQHADLVHVLEE